MCMEMWTDRVGNLHHIFNQMTSFHRFPAICILDTVSASAEKPLDTVSASAGLVREVRGGLLRQRTDR